MSLSPGTKLGPYEVLTPLGAGGMGEVYRAHDQKLRRDVAIKVLPESLATDPEALARFEGEALAVAALSHPNILSIFDFGREGETVFAAMELLDGETLRSRLGSGPLGQRKALELALQLARGLAAAHDKGFVHRDLKPENLFLTKDGILKILDFGLAKRARTVPSADETNTPTATKHTEPGVVLGTVGYMSPEQVAGKPADQKSDIFAFGAVLYEMLSGVRAFRRETGAETMTAILREEPAELAALGVTVTPALERIVEHCLEKQPEGRFRSAHDLAFALEAVSGSTSASVQAKAGLVPAGRRLGLAAVALSTASAVVGALLGWLLRPPTQTPPFAVRPLTQSGRDAEPAASPDGRVLAFSSDRDGTPRIWLRQQGSGDEIALTGGPDHAPRMSPDGTQVLFLRDRVPAGTQDVYRIPILGGEPRRIVPDASSADWSPDGRRIVFTRDGGEPGAPVGRILMAPVEGGEPTESPTWTGEASRTRASAPTAGRSSPSPSVRG